MSLNLCGNMLSGRGGGKPDITVYSNEIKCTLYGMKNMTERKYTKKINNDIL